MHSSQQRLVSIVFTLIDEDGSTKDLELCGEVIGDCKISDVDAPSFSVSLGSHGVAVGQKVDGGVLLNRKKEIDIDAGALFDLVPDEYSVGSMLKQVAGVLLKSLDRVV